MKEIMSYQELEHTNKSKNIIIIILIFLLIVFSIILLNNIESDKFAYDVSFDDFNTTGWEEQRKDELRTNLTVQEQTGIPMYVRRSD